MTNLTAMRARQYYYDIYIITHNHASKHVHAAEDIIEHHKQ